MNIHLNPISEPLEFKTKAEEVYGKLEEFIVFGKLEPGSTLTENEIANLVDAGRTPVREALKLLETDSLVSISRNGVTIAPISGENQLKLLEVRRVILKLCVECAIDRLTPKDVSNLEGLLVDIENRNNQELLAWLKYRQQVLGMASKNKFIYEHLKSMQALSFRFWQYYASEEEMNIRKAHHKALIVCILSKDKSKSIKVVDEIINFLEEFVNKHTNIY